VPRREDAAQRTDRDRAGEVGAREPHAAPMDHHAFDAEIENARALDHELARGRQQQRRRGGDTVSRMASVNSMDDPRGEQQRKR